MMVPSDWMTAVVRTGILLSGAGRIDTKTQHPQYRVITVVNIESFVLSVELV